MPYHLQWGWLLALPAVGLGLALITYSRRRRERWPICSAIIVSSESRDSDWDLLRIRFDAPGQEVTTTVVVRTRGHARQAGESLPIRYNPVIPAEARHAASRGMLHIVGVFLCLVGVIWITCLLLRVGA